MPLSVLNINFASILPEIILTVLALIILVLDFFVRKEDKGILGYLSVIGLLLLLPVVFTTIEPKPSFGGTVRADAFSAFFNVIFVISAILTVVMSMDYLKKVNVQRGEYYTITLFATLGMMVMASANDFVNLYVGLETMAVSFYILVAMRVDNRRSVEGALKYFVLGALSSGILLYGIAFAYGFSGSTNLAEIASASGKLPAENPFMLLAIVLIIVGFSFKIAAFPFHLWSPDAYEGAPVPVAAFLSVGSKAAAFAVFLRVFVYAFPAFHAHWTDLLWMLSAATMFFGAVVAISQRNVVRMLAYSSIAHAGIILMGLLVYNELGAAGILYYLLVYTFMNMGAFTIVAMYVRGDGKGESINDYRGLAATRPVMAFLFALFLLSLAGIPPTGGFAAKFFILASAVSARFYWLAAIGVLSTVISLFFYVKVIFYMYMKEPEESAEEAPRMGMTYNIVLFVTVAGTVIMGVYPSPFMDLAVKAIKPFFM